MRAHLTACLAGLSFSSVALSCFCSPKTGCLALGSKANPVFVGTVLEVTDLPRAEAFPSLSRRKARIEVRESSGGIPSGVREVDILTGAGVWGGGFPFRTGETYLINASAADNGLIHAGICNGTRPVEDAGAALRVLRQRQRGQPAPSLVGRIALYERSFEGILQTRDPLPLVSTIVRLEAEGRIYETLSDSAGLYSFYDVPSGEYRISADLPPGTELAWSVLSEKPPHPVELKAGGCREFDIKAFASGSIQGRVLDSSNNPLPHANIYIVPAAQEALPPERGFYREIQGGKGFFKFIHLPPGQYLILVNPDDTRDPRFPYARTYYPGVHERASAGVITLGAGEQIRDADIRLEPTFIPRRLTVRVTWADGQLIKDFVSVQAQGTSNPGAPATTWQPDSNSSIVELKVLPEEPYQIEAILPCPYLDKRVLGPVVILKSTPFYLDPRDERTELSLALPATACPELPGMRLLNEQFD